MKTRTVGGSAAETFGFDAIGRTTSHGSDLGAFTLTYLGQTAQVAQQALTSTTLKTTLTYLPNASDRRLSAINNTGLTAAKFLNLALTSNAGGQVTDVTETSDLATVYPVASTQSATVNNLNQITALSGTAYTYDLNGNLTGDGVRTYGWDGESRLVRIGYATPAGKLTTMAYDGLSRRTSISSKPNTAGAAVVANYIWCGTMLCQARSSAGAVTRRYLAEGEYVPGTTPVKYYYATDQVGSVRRVFASNGTTLAYAYDPYGNPLQSTAQVTDMGYAGMFTNKDSGLNLTLYRGYNPNTGRWLSMDPVGEAADRNANLYAYVGDDPTNKVDPTGTQMVQDMQFEMQVDSMRQQGMSQAQIDRVMFDQGVKQATALSLVVAPEQLLFRGAGLFARAMGLAKTSAYLKRGMTFALWGGTKPASLTTEFLLSTKVGWTESFNRSVIQRVIQAGRPVRDSYIDTAGRLVARPGSMLELERKMFLDAGWRYSPMTRVWSIPFGPR